MYRMAFPSITWHTPPHRLEYCHLYTHTPIYIYVRPSHYVSHPSHLSRTSQPCPGISTWCALVIFTITIGWWLARQWSGACFVLCVCMCRHTFLPLPSSRVTRLFIMVLKWFCARSQQHQSDRIALIVCSTPIDICMCQSVPLCRLYYSLASAWEGRH